MARSTNRKQDKGHPGKKALLVFLGIFLIVAGLSWWHHSITHKPATKTAARSTSPINTNSPDKAFTTDPQLTQLISNWARQYTFKSAVSVEELSDAMRSATYQPSLQLVPASTYKIYVAYAILHSIEQGSSTLHTRMSDGNSIQTDLNNMILNSDNNAARTLGFYYGWKNINALLASQGLTGTDLYNYVPPNTLPVGDKHTTVQDLALILQKLYGGKLLNAADTQLLLGLMKSQHYRQRIPARLPGGVVVADKPGWLSPADGVNEYVQNDAAIVYGPTSSYILVVMTTGTSTQPLANLSKQVYSYLEG